MKRCLLGFALLLSCSGAWAQFTTVSGTVIDPNGLPYAYGTIASIIVSSNTPKFSSNSQPYFQPTQATGLDVNGKFLVRLADNTLLTPGGTTWTFTVCSTQGTVQPAFGKGPVCFVVTGITISGASQDIGATLTAAALPLTANFSSGGTFPTNPQLGDTIRYNTKGDGAWDATNMAQPVSYFYPVYGGNPISIGPMSTGAAIFGPNADVNATATAGVAKSFTSSSSASTSTVIGMHTGENGNNSVEGMLAFYRFTARLSFGGITNARYWLGLGCYHNTGAGNNGVVINNSTAYAADTPNKTTLGFRYSAGTDTHWQAVSANAGGSQTTVDTGVTPDTNPHTWEMTTNAAGTAVNFLIDGAVVATITTNLPIPANAQDSFGDMFWTADNENTANAVSAIFYFMQISHK